MWNPLRRSLAFGLVCAMIGVLFGLMLYRAGGEPYRFFFLASAAAGLLCGACLWRVLVERNPLRYPLQPVIWGGLAGGLTGITAHYIAWLYYLWAVRLVFVLTAGSPSAAGNQPLTFVESFWGAAGLTIYSLVMVGWLAVLLCGAAGALLAEALFRTGHASA